ncbi:MAG: hypothetical protein WCC66_12990, partial [Rhizobiaceae bacterium]
MGGDLERDVIGWNHCIGFFRANTGENSLGRISMRPSGLSLVLTQNPSDTIASTQKHPALIASIERRTKAV